MIKAVTDKNNFFKILSNVDVSKLIQKRNGLDYLKWSDSWRIIKDNYPESYYTVYENKDSLNYHTDGRTAWVKVGLTLVYEDNGETKSLENIEYLAIMDYKHASIPLDKIRSTDVVNTIQRALCKCAARFGAGIALYASDVDDLPSNGAPQTQEVVEDPETVKLRECIKNIDKRVKELTGTMDRDAKQKFANDVIVPIIGVPNYRNCKDKDKLNELYDKIKAA